MKKVILASTSPSRREILKQTGLKFVCEPSNFDEDMSLKMAPNKLAVHLALGKAKAVAGKHKSAVVIGADSFGVLDGHLLGKPQNLIDAKKMLAKLSGRQHSFITGFAIVDSDSGKTISSSVETNVYFRKISKSEISAYIKTGEPLNKAGAYAIQGIGSIFVKKVEGDYLNVMGMPVSAVSEKLRHFGIEIL